MELSSLLVGGAAVGIVSSMWAYIKAVLWKICNLFIQKIDIDHPVLSDALIAYLIKHYQFSPLYDRLYGVNMDTLREETEAPRRTYIPYEEYGRRPMIFWSKWWLPFFLHELAPTQKKEPGSPTSSGLTSASSSDDKRSLTIICLRGSINVDEMIFEATKERDSLLIAQRKVMGEHTRRFFVNYVPSYKGKDQGPKYGESESVWHRFGKYRIVGYPETSIGLKNNQETPSLDRLVYPKHVKSMIDEMKIWFRNRQWYQNRGIPWKRGWLLYGPPGTGKTALTRAIAEDLDLPIFVFNLGELSNADLMDNWNKMQAHAPCIALIEDIDNVFHGRTNVASSQRSFFSLLQRRNKEPDDTPGGNKDDRKDDMMSGALNFDVFLNCLDGIERSDGVFTIITTNDLSKIDSALGQVKSDSNDMISTRPGRIDKTIELSYMTNEDKKLLAEKIIGEYEDVYYAMLTFIDENPDIKETAAQFQERCCQKALEKFWELEQQMIRDEAAEQAQKGIEFVSSGITCTNYEFEVQDNRSYKY